MPFVDPPAETVDPDGFLIDQYASEFAPSGLPDSHHANVDYGVLLNREVEEFLAR